MLPEAVHYAALTAPYAEAVPTLLLIINFREKSAMNNAETNIQSEQEEPKRSLLKNILNTIWKTCKRMFAESDDVIVEQIRDRQGHICWCIYNPFTGQPTYFSSTTEVRHWLEDRHNH
jgi:hypothetical protein